MSVDVLRIDASQRSELDYVEWMSSFPNREGRISGDSLCLVMNGGNCGVYSLLFTGTVLFL